MLYLSGFGGDSDSPALLVYDGVKSRNLISKRYEKNNSWLSECGDFLVSVNEASPVSMLYLLSKDATTLYDSLTIDGGNLCHLSYIKKSELLVGACYATGNIFWVKISSEKKNFAMIFIIISKAVNRGEPTVLSRMKTKLCFYRQTSCRTEYTATQ